MLRVEDIRRLELEVTSSSDNDDTVAVTAVADLDYAPGKNAALEMSGTYTKATGAFKFDPVEWLKAPPPNVPSKQLIGSLTDDGEFLIGSISTPLDCVCDAAAAPSGASFGLSCKIHEGGAGGTENPWCYVSSQFCPDAVQDEKNPDSYWAYCPGEAYSYQQECSVVELARVCAVPKVQCDTGWVRNDVQNRCYKVFGSGDDKPLSFNDASDACISVGGNLASIHSPAENTFVSGQIKNAEGSGPALTPWFGLTRAGPTISTPWMWTDGTIVGYGKQFLRSSSGTCVTGSSNSRQAWSTDACSGENAYICRKVAGGRDASCDCTGEADTNHNGAVCNFFHEGKPAWCHVNKNCPSAVRSTVKDSRDLFRANCFVGAASTTTAAQTTTPDVDNKCHADDETKYQTSNGTCAACTVLSDCGDKQILRGSCSDFSTPTCVDCNGNEYYSTTKKRCFGCYLHCNTCDGPDANDCTSCPDGTAAFLEGTGDGTHGACTTSCHEQGGVWKNAKTQTCDKCATCKATEYLKYPCTEFSNSQCRTIRTCRETSQYESAAPTATTDRGCRPLTICQEGDVETVKPTSTSDRECKLTTTTTTTTTTTIPGAKCAWDEYAKVPQTPTSTRVCAKMSCGAGQHVTRESDRTDWENPTAPVCSSCPPGTYSDKAVEDLCGPGNLCDCDSHSDCNPGFEEAVAPTSSSDRVCQICQTGTAGKGGGSDSKCEVCDGTTSFSSGQGLEMCTPMTVCDAGSEQSGGSQYEDRVCNACISGETFSTAGEKCERLTVCTAGQKVISIPTPGQDRQCGPCDNNTWMATDNEKTKCEAPKLCTAGEFIAAEIPPDKKSDRVCSSCAPGTFSVTENEKTCTPYSECPAGSVWESEKPSNRDRDCVVCPEGSFQPNAGTESCIQSSFPDGCPAGTFMSAGPTTTSDRVCNDCDPAGMDETDDSFGFTQTVNRQSRCQSPTVCRPGEGQIIAPTKTTDRKCSQCSLGKFSDASNGEPCKPFSVCPIGTYQQAEGKSEMDTLCTTCPVGTFAARSGQTTCDPLKTCQINQGVSPAGRESGNEYNQGLSSDRECSECGKGTVQCLEGGVFCAKPVVGAEYITASDTCGMVSGQDTFSLQLSYRLYKGDFADGDGINPTRDDECESVISDDCAISSDRLISEVLRTVKNLIKNADQEQISSVKTSLKGYASPADFARSDGQCTRGACPFMNVTVAGLDRSRYKVIAAAVAAYDNSAAVTVRSLRGYTSFITGIVDPYFVKIINPKMSSDLCVGTPIAAFPTETSDVVCEPAASAAVGTAAIAGIIAGSVAVIAVSVIALKMRKNTAGVFLAMTCFIEY